MRGDIGPVIVPGPAGDEYRSLRERLKGLNIAEARNHPLKQLLADIALPGSSERRELELAIEKCKSDIEKSAGPLLQGLAVWQKGTGEVIQDILKMAYNAVELYESFPEYPLNDNFKDYGEDKEKASKRRELRISYVNQAVALYYWKTLQELNGLNITNKPEFRGMLHHLEMLKAKLAERADVDRAANEFERQAGLARFQYECAQKHDGESAAHSASIQSLSDVVGKHYLWRLLRAGEVEKYREQSEKRAKELEGVLADVKRYRRETEAKIASYISQAKKRYDANSDAVVRKDLINATILRSQNRFTEAQERVRAIDDLANRVLRDQENYYRILANRIIEGDIQPNEVTEAIEGIRDRVWQTRDIAEKAKKRLKIAKDGVKSAEERAEKAIIRAEEARAYNDDYISDELPKDVEKCAKNVEELEKKLVESASLSQFNDKKIQNNIDSISFYIAKIQYEARRTDNPEERAKNLAEFMHALEKAEIAKNAAIAFEVKNALAEQKVLSNLIDKLEEESSALEREDPNAERVHNLACVIHEDIIALRSVVAAQKRVEVALGGAPAEDASVTPSVVSLHEVFASPPNPYDEISRGEGSGSGREDASDPLGFVPHHIASPLVPNRYGGDRGSGSGREDQETHDSWSSWEKQSVESFDWDREDQETHDSWFNRVRARLINLVSRRRDQETHGGGSGREEQSVEAFDGGREALVFVPHQASEALFDPYRGYGGGGNGSGRENQETHGGGLGAGPEQIVIRDPVSLEGPESLPVPSPLSLELGPGALGVPPTPNLLGLDFDPGSLGGPEPVPVVIRESSRARSRIRGSSGSRSGIRGSSGSRMRESSRARREEPIVMRAPSGLRREEPEGGTSSQSSETTFSLYEETRYPAGLVGLIQRVREQSHAARNIHDAILAGQNIRDLKDQERACRELVSAAQEWFMDQLKDAADLGETAAGALKRNAIYMGRDAKGDANKAIEWLQKIKDDLAARDEDGLKKRSKGHLFIDPKAGKFTINGVWMSVREVNRWDFSVPGQTTVEYRPDITKIEIETITREAQGGRQNVDSVYTKRLSERYFRSADFEFLLNIPGQSYTHGGRSEGHMTIIDLKKKDGKIQKTVPLQAATAKALAQEAAAEGYITRGLLARNEGEKAVDAWRRSVAEATERFKTVSEVRNAIINNPAATQHALDTAEEEERTATEDAAVHEEISKTINAVGVAAEAAVMAAEGADKAVKEVSAFENDGGLRTVLTSAIDLLKEAYGDNIDNRDIIAKLVVIFGNSVGWTEAEYKAVKTFDMRAASKIKIKENHNNQSYPVEVLFDVVTETMPGLIINHRDVLSMKRPPAWSDEEKRHMCKIDLDRQVLILPNGQEYNMKDFDWTETKWDEENGLSLQFKGPKELSQVNLIAAGSSDIFDEKLSNDTAALKKKAREQVETGIELIKWGIKQAIESDDERGINNIVGTIQSSEGVLAHESSMTEKELTKPPKNKMDLEKARRKKKAQSDALTPKWVTHSIQSTAGMFEARQVYDNEVKERIRTIHKNNPLSAKRVWKSRANPERYALIKHKSSKKKQELLDEIRAAEHLDKTLSFELLEDPKLGLASPIKNAAPNGLELLREYNLYVDKQDFASETERQNVVHYVETITREFETNPDIDVYAVNRWHLQRAGIAADNNNFLSRNVDDDGIQVVGVIECIRSLKQVDRPPISDKSLASLRQDYEYRWVTFLRNALTEADTEGMAELLRRALPVAKWMQESRFSNLKLVEGALDPEIPSEQAEKILDGMQTPGTPMPWPEVDEKPTVSEDQKPDSKIDPKAITKKSDGELALEAGKTAEQIYKSAANAIENLIESTSDPIMQQRYREKAVEMAMDIAKQAFQINKQDKEIQNQWQKLEEMVKTMDSQRWKDLWKELWLLWIKTSVESGSKGVQKFMDELMKLVGKSIA